MRKLLLIAILLLALPGFAATQTLSLGSGGDGGVVDGYSATATFDTVTLLISQIQLTVAGVGRTCHVNAANPPTGLSISQDFAPNPNGSPKTFTITVPANAATMYTLIASPHGGFVFDGTSSTFTYDIHFN